MSKFKQIRATQKVKMETDLLNKKPRNMLIEN